jgi:hypothetical protein
LQDASAAPVAYPRLEALVQALDALGDRRAAAPLRQRLRASGHVGLPLPRAPATG